MKREEKRQIRACPRYSICCDLVFPDRSKINRAASVILGAQKCGPDSPFGASPSPLAFRGLRQHEQGLLIYCAKHRFISETAGYTERFHRLPHMPSLPPPTAMDPSQRTSNKKPQELLNVAACSSLPLLCKDYWSDF